MSLSLLLLIICISVVVVLVLRITLASSSSLEDVPGPSNQSWIFGNMRELILGEFGTDLFAWQALYGSIHKIKGCFGEDRLIISDPRALAAITSDIRLFPRAIEHRELARTFLGPGLFWAEGDDHARQKAIVQPCFNVSVLRDNLPRFIDKARILSERLNQEVTGGPKLIDVSPWLHRASIDIIGSAAFNYEFNSLLNNDDPVAQSFIGILDETTTRSPSAILADAVLHYLPPSVLPLFDHLPVKAMKILKRNREDVYRLAKKLVESTVDLIERDVELDKSVLTQVVKSNQQADAKLKMNLTEVYGQVMTFLQAGEISTAHALNWTLYELSRNETYQEKVRSEVTELWHAVQQRSNLEWTTSDLERLVYTNALIKEILRYYPGLPLSQRTSSKDTVLPLSQPVTLRSRKTVDELPIKRNQEIIMSISGYNRLETIFGKDAHIFDPERWLDSRTSSIKGYTGIYNNLMSFLSGERACIGFRFALIEMQVVLVELVRTLRFTLPPDVQIRPELATNLVPVRVGDCSKASQMPLMVLPVE